MSATRFRADIGTVIRFIGPSALHRTNERRNSLDADGRRTAADIRAVSPSSEKPRRRQRRERSLTQLVREVPQAPSLVERESQPGHLGVLHLNQFDGFLDLKRWHGRL